MRRFWFKKNKGQALVVSYMAIAILMVYSSGLLMKAIAEKNTADRARLTAEAFYLAEGAAENTIAAFISDIANFNINAAVSGYNATTTFASFNNFSASSSVTALESGDRTVVDSLGRNTFVRNYEVVSSVTHPENSGIQVTLHQVIARSLIPTFQHLIFYDQDLEVLPGANMTLSGRIHANHDIYINSRDTLTVDTFYLRSAGSIYNSRKDDPSDPMGGDVEIRVNKSGSPKYEDMDGLDCDDADWAIESQERWEGTVMSAVHGVNDLAAPSVGAVSPTGYYANQANVVVTNNAIVKNGVTLQEGVDYPVGTVTTTTTSFYNNREGEYIKMTEIDMAKLSGLSGTCSGGSCPNNLPSNGLLYATRTDGGASQPGVKLVNGSEIPRSGGLTVVSDAPVYIKGDYNTTNEKPASVIADTINLLSNNWSDANSASGLSSRTAAVTSYNTAFMAGVDTTSVGHYNGGLENYPRFHEGWSAVDCNIKGSFVGLWNPSVAAGAWQYGSPQYTAPRRNWTYNSMYNNAANLPPFTPVVVEAERVVWWQE